MTTEKLLQWADEIVFAKTEKHLNSVQTAILEGALQGLKYEEIAKTCHRSKSHIKNIASELWQTLSELLREDVNKANVCSILERKATSNIYNYGNSSPIFSAYINSHINICSESQKYSENDRQRSPSSSDSTPTPNRSPIIDLTDAPEVTEFCDRTPELITLKKWILKDRTRLITIYGLRGIGKSFLALKLIEHIGEKFDYIIWKSLIAAPKLSALKKEIKHFFDPSQFMPSTTTIDESRNGRCLLILDDLQNLFASRQLSGEYLTGYQDYGTFLQQVVGNNHHSCVILLSWDKPREIVALEAENKLVRTLQLRGLGETATEILRHRELTDEDKWQELITLYQGHPVWLNIIASTILELFNGRVSLFLDDEIFIGDLSPILASQLERLSDLEQQVIDWIADEPQPVDISQKPADGVCSKSELWQVIQSLVRRGLIEKVSAGERSEFQLNPVFKQYLQGIGNRDDKSV